MAVEIVKKPARKNFSIPFLLLVPLALLLPARPLVPAAAPAPPALEKGRVLPSVVCREDKDFSFALYLPKAYTPEKKWPVIFCFSPLGRGEVPVRLLAEPAERYGFIVVGSNDSRNGPWKIILKAQTLLWKEVNRRFPVDRGRSYAAGFSGGARAGLYLALSHKKRFAGVISCGAFEAERREIPKRSRLTLVMIVGDGDFNLFEFTRAERRLTKRGNRHWLEIVPGPHRWPPPSKMAEAVDLLVAGDMLEKRLPEDDALLRGLVDDRLVSARALEERGDIEKAYRTFQQTARFFSPVSSARRASAEAARLQGTPEVRRAIARELTFEGYRERLRRSRDTRQLSRLLDELKAIRDKGGPDAASAKMILDLAALSLNQKGLAALQAGAYPLAAFFLDTSAVLLPENAVSSYNAACAHARLGEKKKALASLRESVRRGYRDAGHLRSDPDLKSLREEPEFQAILRGLERPSGGS